MRSAKSSRLFGSVTAAFGPYTLVRPGSLVQSGGPDSPETQARRRRNLVRVIRAPDVVPGASKVPAALGMPPQAPLGSRVACDRGADIGLRMAVPPRLRAGRWGPVWASAVAEVRRAG